MSTKNSTTVNWGNGEVISDPSYEVVIRAPLSAWEATVADMGASSRSENQDLYDLLAEKFPNYKERK